LVGATGGGGAAYVFDLQQKSTAADGAQQDYFGRSVSINGDTAIVGANGKNAAYVFARSDGVWTKQQELTADNGAPGDYFGYSVSVSGDMALVGAHEKNSTTGAAYMFVRDNQGHWSQQQELTASD